jgi:cephalosporin-C deacetylase-like acetyl esterase
VTEVSVEDTSFVSGPGSRLAGRIYRPSSARDHRAGIVFCHGFSGTKEGTPPGMARLFAESGFTVLTFDYRGFGGSEGPKGRIVPSEQVEDAIHALEFLSRDGAVDPERIGLYGNSFGGGVSLLAAIASARPKSLVLSVPVVSGSRWLRSICGGEGEFTERRRRAMAAIADKTATGRMALVNRFEIMIPDAGTRKRYTDLVEVTLETFQHVLSHEPLAVADKLTIPVAVFGVRNDRLVPFEQTTMLYEKLTAPKTLRVFDSDNHYAVYDDLLSDVASDASAWFEKHLLVKGQQ